jgi:hypothetical protein
MRNVRRNFRFLIPVLFISGGLLMGAAVMFLWNAILVPVLHVGALSFWQGLGLLALSRILFGGFRGGSWGAGHRGGPWKDKWRSMSEGERMQMKAAWKDRCRPNRQEGGGMAGEGRTIPVTD